MQRKPPKHKVLTVSKKNKKTLLKLQANQIHESWKGKNILILSMLYFSHLQKPADKISCSKLVCKYQLFGTHP